MLLPLRLSKEREGRSAIQLVSSFCMPFLILNRFSDLRWFKPLKAPECKTEMLL
jgi:hypothetical protein